MDGRLGGRIVVQRGWEENRRAHSGLSICPEKMRGRALRASLCGNENCKMCECLDKCRFGQEAVKRGMFDDAV